ncbi:hypothetical protein IWQ60_002317 [Tieghemiomyces parasiticus]|uniref:MFS general substrate transporter n=1 Tax=Tieghemiomyces parasiticus TaxID=78921 RepID=A0A9W8E1R3_9FUNG|nr:hypothetical protein IWQ60_002317 [Tieghemiomyces parasiticus]
MGQAYRSTYAQFLIVAAIYFFAQASYMIVNGVGGGGLKDSSVAARSNFFANIASSVVGLFSGALHNYLGSRLALLIGCLAYMFYALSYFIYGMTGNPIIVFVAGICFGLSVTLFWTAQGSLMLSYPSEEHRGKYITTFFLAFSASGIIGGLMTIFLNLNSTSSELGVETYWAAIAAGAVGTILTFFLRPNSRLVRDDGGAVETVKFSGWRNEMGGMGKVFTNRHMLLLTPVFMVFGTYFTYISNGYNFSLFTIQARGLNATLFSVSGMAGSLVFGFFMDKVKLALRPRGFLVASVLTALICVSWISASFVQGSHTRESEHGIFGLNSSYYWSILIIYIIWGFLDSTLNAFSFWIMGGVTSDATELARFTGYSRCLQGLGGVLSWGLDTIKVPYIIMLWVSFALLLVGMAFSVFSIMILPQREEDSTFDTSSEHEAFAPIDDKKAPKIDRPGHLEA